MSITTMFIDGLSNWNVSALKGELQRCGPNSMGTRPALVLRLQQFYEEQLHSSEPEVKP